VSGNEVIQSQGMAITVADAILVGSTALETLMTMVLFAVKAGAV